jgi:hypothetical protein
MALTWPVLNQNQFTQGPVLGQLTFDPQPATIPCQLNPSTAAATGTVTAGCAVKLIAYAGPQIIVDVTTSASDGPVYGVIEYSKQKNVYVPGDQFNVAGKGNILHHWANGAINRGQRVSITNPSTVLTPPAVSADVTAGDFTVGFALGQASGQNNFLRIQIDPSLNNTVSGSSFASVSP